MQNVSEIFFYKLNQLDERFLFRNEKKLASACSGGPDSTFLTLLLHQWCQARNIQLCVFIVDHQLRPESALESKKTYLLLRDTYGIDSTILTLHGVLPSQKHARDSRYEVLLDSCQKNSIQYLFLGHHLDDQIETFFLRLMRKSGPRGLCGMQESVSMRGICLIRPLLLLYKQAIKNFLDQNSIPYIVDSSNVKECYMRSRVRNMLQGQDLLKEESILSCMHKIQKIVSALDDVVMMFIQKCDVSRSSISFKRDEFLLLPTAVQEGILHYIINYLRPRTYPIRDSKCMRLRNIILYLQRSRATCAGCDFHIGEIVHVHIEKKR